MHAVAISLLWCVVQVTLFAGAACVVYLVARRIQSRAAATAVVASMLMILLLTSVAASPWPQWRWEHTGAHKRSVVAASTPPPSSNKVDMVPATTGTIAQADTPASIDLFASLQSLAESIAGPTPLVAAEAPAPTWTARDVVGLLLCVCLAWGVVRLMWGLIQVRGLLRRSTTIDDEPLTEELARLRNQLHLTYAVALRESVDVATPATVGFVTPTILLPYSWREWTADETRAVLAHELSHVASRDYLSWIVARLTVALHFYHPLVHWLAGRLQLEQELSADAQAADLMGDRQQYLQLLASLALATPPHRLVGPARTLVPNRSLLMRRVEMLRTSAKTAAKPKGSSTLRLACVGLLLMLAIGVAGVRRDAIAQPAKTTAGNAATAESSAPDSPKFSQIEPPNPIPLEYVPPSAVFVATLRPGAITENAEMAKALNYADQRQLLARAGLTIRDVAELMFLLPGKKYCGPRAIVRFTTPEACREAFTSLLGERPKSLGMIPGSGMMRGRTASDQVTQLDEITIAVEPYAWVESQGGTLPELKTNLVHPWSNDWERNNDAQLVAAINVAPSRPSFLQELNESTARGNFFVATLVPLVNQTNWATATGEMSSEGFQLKLSANCENAEGAKQVASTAQALLTLCGGFLGSQRVLISQAAIAPEANTTVWGMSEARKKTLAKLCELGERALASATTETHDELAHITIQSDSLNVESLGQTAKALLPTIEQARIAARRAQSKNNLKQLSLALLNYEATYNRLPMAANYAEGSKHPYSWRVALLPFLEQQSLYDQYRFDEPWDSEANKLVLEQIPDQYRSPFDDPASTSAGYFVFSGPATVLNAEHTVQLRNITDGTSNTLTFVEAKRAIPWTKPEDIAYAADSPLPKLDRWTSELHAAMCDGSVHALADDIAEERLRALITKAGGEIVPRQ